jgi:hypothetical protein
METGITLFQSIGNSIELGEAGITITTAETLTIEASMIELTGSTIEITGAMVTVEAGMTEFVGVINTPTIIAESVVGTAYTPGAGNIL